MLVVAIMLYTWCAIAFTNVAATLPHYVALVLVIVNGLLYFNYYKVPVLLTGAILLLATFNLITFYSSTSTFVLNIGQTFSLEFQYWSLLLLVVLYYKQQYADIMVFG